MSAARLHEYLLGESKLAKRVQYKRGGDFGTWRGCATFEATTDHELRLAESGQFFFDENPGRGMVFRAKPLVFDMSTSPVEVRFDDGPFHTLDADAVMYFSFVTQTTLGYSDIVPLAPAARAPEREGRGRPLHPPPAPAHPPPPQHRPNLLKQDYTL